MMVMEGSIQNCIFYDPQGKGSCARAWTYKSCGENALFLLLYSQAWIRQTMFIVMMTKEGSTHITDFMAPGQGFLQNGFGQKASSLLPGIDQTN